MLEWLPGKRRFDFMDFKTIKVNDTIFSPFIRTFACCFIVYLITHLFQSGPDISQFDDHWPINLLAL
jgi:hypothetical protein